MYRPGGNVGRGVGDGAGAGVEGTGVGAAATDAGGGDGGPWRSGADAGSAQAADTTIAAMRRAFDPRTVGA